MNHATTAHSAALKGCLEVCERCQRLVAAVVDRRPPDDGRLFRMIGPHLRHCLDHFTNLLRGLPAGDIDYDARDREAALERDPRRLGAALERTMSDLAALADIDPARPLRVRQQAASDSPPEAVASTLDRELVFLSSHTIHHLALMVHLIRAEGLAVPAELGVAFSTAAHRDRLDQGSAR